MCLILESSGLLYCVVDYDAGVGLSRSDWSTDVAYLFMHHCKMGSYFYPDFICRRSVNLADGILILLGSIFFCG
jgi:hypothetical protein